MASDIPWIKKEEQPEHSNDIMPMCFFQLQTIDDDNETNINDDKIDSYKNFPNNLYDKDSAGNNSPETEQI